jgi:hypothetical protein
MRVDERREVKFESYQAKSSQATCLRIEEQREVSLGLMAQPIERRQPQRPRRRLASPQPADERVTQRAALEVVHHQ